MKMGLTKAIADLRSQPVRVALLWIAIAVGALAVMAGFGSRVVLEREIRASFDGSDPAAVVVWTDDVDASLLARVSEVDGVTGVDARRLVRARVEATDGDWRSLLLYGVRDFSNMHVSRVYPVEGQWPPPTGSVVVEQSAVAVVRSSVGEPIVVRVAGGSGPHEIDVAGIAHDPARAPGWQDNLGYAYATPETLSALGLGEQLDELHIDVAGDRDQAQLVATRVDAVMAEMGVPVHRVEVPPRKHPHADHMQAMLLLLQVLAALSLLLSALLAANLFASMLARHTRQIGVMKTLGGSPLMISRIYLALAGIVSVSASGVGAMGGVFVSQQFRASRVGSSISTTRRSVCLCGSWPSSWSLLQASPSQQRSSPSVVQPAWPSGRRSKTWASIGPANCGLHEQALDCPSSCVCLSATRSVAAGALSSRWSLSRSVAPC